MLRFLMQRLLALVPVLFTVAVIVFLILRLTPGDPAAVIAGNNATNEDIDRIREQLGLTKPLLTQFMIWLGNVVQGDLGYSFYLNKPVTELIAQRIGRYAQRVGRENVIAGSDCGYGTWVGQAAVDPDIVWAKMAAMAEGARIASERFWPAS